MRAFVLVLNDMRSPKIEIVRPAVRADTPEELVAFMERERVEPYREPTGYLDGTWYKVFRKGGPLEWFNPPFGDTQAIYLVDAESEGRAHTDETNRRLSMLPSVG